jgi:hypothetical protein
LAESPNSSNTLKDLFVRIGLTGAKDALKGLNKLDKGVEKTTKKFSKFGMVFKKLGKAAKVGLGGAFGVVQSVFGNFARTLNVTFGIIISQILNAVSRGLALLTGSAVRFAAAEEAAVENLKLALFLRKKYTRETLKGFSDIAGKIQRTRGVSADDLLLGAATQVQGGMKLGRVKRTMNIAGLLAALEPKTSATKIMKELQELLNTGVLGRTLKKYFPKLEKISDKTEVAASALSFMEKDLKRFKIFGQLNTYAANTRRLTEEFGEFLKSAGRPIRDMFSFLSRGLTTFLRGVNIKGIGTTFASVVGSFYRKYIGGTGLAGEFNTPQKMIKNFVKVVSRWIRIGGIFLMDVIDFFTGEKSAIAEIFGTKEFWPLMKKIGIEIFKEGWKIVFASLGELMKEGAKGTGKALIDRDVKFMLKTLIFFLKAKNGISDIITGEGRKKELEQQKRDTKKVIDALLPKKSKKDASINVNDGTKLAANFNNTITIYTSQPADAVRRNLAGMFAAAANNGMA